MAKEPWFCACAISMKEIRARINFGREMQGLRPLTMMRFYQLRMAAAEEFLAAHDSRRHGNKGLDRNPFLPNRLIGNNYIFNAQRDRKSTRLNSSHVSESRMPSSA